MVGVPELQAWLATLPADGFVAVDGGGLALVLVEDPDTYYEVGGIPDPEEE